MSDFGCFLDGHLLDINEVLVLVEQKRGYIRVLGIHFDVAKGQRCLEHSLGGAQF
jgi:hypothetical protein